MTDWKRVESLIKKLHSLGLSGSGMLYYTYDTGLQIEMFVDSLDPLVVSSGGCYKTIEEQLEAEVESMQIEFKHKLDDLTRERDNVQSKLDKINEQMEILN